MGWETAKQIVEEFGLPCAVEDEEGIRLELRRRLVDLHPDKNGGNFASDEDETKYKEFSSAYEFMKSKSRGSTALISIDDITAIIRAVGDSKNEIGDRIGRLRSEYDSESQRVVGRRYYRPRLSSGIFAAICGSLFTFSGSLEAHPLLGTIITQEPVQVLMLMGVVFSGLLFLLTWLEERQDEALAEHVVTEQARQEIFRTLMRQKKSSTFSVLDVAEVIDQQWNQPETPRGLLTAAFARRNRRLNPSLLEKVAHIHLLELERRGTVRRLETPSLDAIYEFDAGLLQTG